MDIVFLALIAALAAGTFGLIAGCAALLERLRGGK